MADGGGDEQVVHAQFVAQEGLDEEFGVEVALDLGEERLLEDLGKGLLLLGLAIEGFVMGEGAGQLIVFEQPIGFQHAAEEEAVQQLLTGEGQVGQRAGLVAEGEAIGQEQAPAFEVGQKALVERGLLLLVVEFVNAARFEVLGRQQLPQLVTPG